MEPQSQAKFDSADWLSTKSVGAGWLSTKSVGAGWKPGHLDKAVGLLERLVATPSVSRSEDATATILYDHLCAEGVKPVRVLNNLIAMAPGYDPKRPTLLLNSHHDTVKPSPDYTFDPFTPTRRDGRIYGLGSNDAGASVVSLTTAFCHLKDTPLPFNLLLTLSAEEEVMGENGTRALLPHLESLGIRPSAGIIGEPTGMHPAVGERGLMVLDCTAHGRTGHAARNEGINALYKAVDDIERLRNFKFDRQSDVLGPIKLTVTQIEAGRQHNVVPEVCRFVVDVRTTDAYTNEQTARIIADALESEVKPRSYRIRASVIDTAHPLVQGAIAQGGVPYVSPTTSDMALMPDFPTLKLGPGDSARSHTADEYIVIDEIADAITKYIRLIQNLKL